MSIHDFPVHPGPPYVSKGNMYLTQALFYDRMLEAASFASYRPVFTLYREKPGYICCRTTFVAIGDPTGYKWAMEYLGDWDHWLRLLRCDWFREAYEHWLAELNTKLKSEAFDRIRLIAEGETPQAMQASKFIATEEMYKAKKGRPSRSDIDAELKREIKTLSVHDEDMQRIGLSVIKGGKTNG